MEVAWTLSNGVTERTLSAWGITTLLCARRSYSPDDLTFSVKREDVLAESTFPEGTALTLKRDGVPVFIGSVVSVTAVAGDGTEVDQYVAQNAWYQLERLVYQQTRCVYDESFAVALPQPTSHVVLGLTALGGRYIHTTAAMVDVCTYALSQGVPITLGSIAGGIDFPLEELRDVTCAEILRRLGAYTPDSVMWVDYSTGVQRLNFGRRSGLAAVEKNLLASDEVVAFSVRSRPDLVPAGVRFDFVGAVAAPSGYAVTRISSQFAGLPAGPGVLVATIQLDGAGTSNQARAPLGLAAEYFAALQPLQFEGGLALKGRDVSGEIHPGKVLNFSNGRAAWATMRAMVQTVTEDILTGVTSVEFGPPERLPAQDFVDQLMFARRVKPDTNMWSVMTCIRGGPDIGDDGEVEGTGEDEGPNPDAGRDPDDATSPDAVIEGCVGGQLKYFRVKGSEVSG